MTRESKDAEIAEWCVMFNELLDKIRCFDDYIVHKDMFHRVTEYAYDSHVSMPYDRMMGSGITYYNTLLSTLMDMSSKIGHKCHTLADVYKVYECIKPVLGHCNLEEVRELCEILKISSARYNPIMYIELSRLLAKI